ncbi:ROK family protein [bacterium]|nr:ROK family protein [bacterium]MCI0617060.1 ROK family protein [bacterium]
MPEQQYVVGIDVGGTNIKAGAVDYQGNILATIKTPSEASAGRDAFLNKLQSIVTDLTSQMKGQSPMAIGFGIPGAIHAVDGVVTQAPNFPALNGIPLRDLMSERLKLPCFIDNDANCIAFGEMWTGAGRGYSHILLLALGTGIGGGVIIDDEMLRGADGMAGELGHIAVEIDGAPCNCGSVGCLETIASATGILRMFREQKSKHPESPLNSMQESSITPAVIFGEAVKGDQFSRAIIEQAGRGLGVGMASFINIFNPEIVIIGGGVAAAWDILIPPAIETMKKRAFKAPAARVKVVRAEKENDAGIFGTAYLAWDELRRGDQLKAKRERRLAPWGFWEVIEEGKDYKVKRLYVHPGHRLSYQKHQQREETWMVSSGQAAVTLDGKELILNAGETIHIAKTQAHRVGNPSDQPLIFFEVQRGTYFGEDDIIRLQDDYRRNS